eukprot:2424098-Prymnesium_polylepis.1
MSGTMGIGGRGDRAGCLGGGLFGGSRGGRRGAGMPWWSPPPRHLRRRDRRVAVRATHESFGRQGAGVWGMEFFASGADYAAAYAYGYGWAVIHPCNYSAVITV